MRKLAGMVDVELKGADVITLGNGAELHFLGTIRARRRGAMAICMWMSIFGFLISSGYAT